jgi:hypothetical protein
MGGPPSTIIAYACAADTESFAASGTRPNSMYTHYLLRYITTPNVDIDMVLKNVAVEVQRESVNEQVPFLYTNCNERICLNANPWPNIPVWPGAVQFNPLLCKLLSKNRLYIHFQNMFSGIRSTSTPKTTRRSQYSATNQQLP